MAKREIVLTDDKVTKTIRDNVLMGYKIKGVQIFDTENFILTFDRVIHRPKEKQTEFPET